jgi:gamma-glutamylcyclotransferase (GGCT)/AIG2-like uncharacterized protein YtfP
MKRGEPNNWRLHGQKFIGEFNTLPEYDIYDLGGYPGLKKGNSVVQGEIWEVSRPCLDQIDSMEGHPFVYFRQPIKTNSPYKAQAYFYEKSVLDKKRIEYSYTCRR